MVFSTSYKEALIYSKVNRAKYSDPIKVAEYDRIIVDTISFLYRKPALDVTNDYADTKV